MTIKSHLNETHTKWEQEHRQAKPHWLRTKDGGGSQTIQVLPPIREDGRTHSTYIKFIDTGSGSCASGEHQIQTFYKQLCKLGCTCFSSCI